MKLIYVQKKLKVVCLIVFLISIGLVNLQTVKAQENKEKSLEKTDRCDACCSICREKYLASCPSAPVLLDKYSSSATHEWEMGRLDKLLTQVQNNPAADAVIVVYGGRVNKYNEFEIRTKRIKDYIEYRKFEIERIKIVHGGFREEFEFELWISPIQNSLPPLSPTIAPEKVKFIGKMKPFTI